MGAYGAIHHLFQSQSVDPSAMAGCQAQWAVRPDLLQEEAFVALIRASSAEAPCVVGGSALLDMGHSLTRSLARSRTHSLLTHSLCAHTQYSPAKPNPITVQCSAVGCSAVQWGAVECSAVECSAKMQPVSHPPYTAVYRVYTFGTGTERVRSTHHSHISVSPYGVSP